MTEASRVIHARRTAIGVRFREWSPAEERYATPEMVQVTMREHLIALSGDVDAVDAMIRRALCQGTSEPAKRRDQDGAWDKEKEPVPQAKAS